MKNSGYLPLADIIRCEKDGFFWALSLKVAIEKREACEVFGVRVVFVTHKYTEILLDTIETGI